MTGRSPRASRPLALALLLILAFTSPTLLVGCATRGLWSWARGRQDPPRVRDATGIQGASIDRAGNVRLEVDAGDRLVELTWPSGVAGLDGLRALPTRQREIDPGPRLPETAEDPASAAMTEIDSLPLPAAWPERTGAVALVLLILAPPPEVGGRPRVVPVIVLRDPRDGSLAKTFLEAWWRTEPSPGRLAVAALATVITVPIDVALVVTAPIWIIPAVGIYFESHGK